MRGTESVRKGVGHRLITVLKVKKTAETWATRSEGPNRSFSKNLNSL